MGHILKSGGQKVQIILNMTSEQSHSQTQRQTNSAPEKPSRFLTSAISLFILAKGSEVRYVLVLW